LKPWLADLRLRDTTTPDIQQVLEAIHKQGKLNHDSIRALRYLLKIIFDHAIRMGLLNTNPVSSTKVPKRSDDEEIENTYAYSVEEIQQMLRVLPEPARTAVATDAFTGVRCGELAGLLWENFDGTKESMQITRSVWEGHVTKTKTKKSKAPVPIIKPLVRILEAHRLRTAQLKVDSAQKQAARARKVLETGGDSLAPETRERLGEVIKAAEHMAKNPPVPIAGPIFASRKGTPLNMNNVLNRQILPALRKAKLKDRDGAELWHGWHGFRRGLGTNLKHLGVDLKTIQEILRHAHIAKTADIYVKEVSEQAVEAMKRLEKHVEAELKMPLGPAYSAPNLQQLVWSTANKPN
jgi:integrase